VTRSKPRPEFAPEAGLSGGILDGIVLLDGGAEAYPRMLLSIEQARRFIHLEVYAFLASGVGHRFIEALGNASRRGVGVEVIIDGWGSVRDGRAVKELLQNAGCSVRIFSRLRSLLLGRLGRNHRKLLLIDDQVAYIGGINIGDENLAEGSRVGWADLALEIRGSPCARLGAMIRDEPRSAGDGLLRIYLSGLGGGWRLRRRYLKAFARARERIHLAHGYFLPDPAMVRAITAASRRGVKVHLLLAGRSDVPFTRAATRSLYRRLLVAGVEIREWSDSVLHAKVATVDKHYLLVGSFNLDPFSLTNQEVLVAVTEPQVVIQAEKWIEDHFACAQSIISEASTTFGRRWVLDPLGRVLAHLADKASRTLVARRRLRYSKMSGSSPPAPGIRVMRKMLVAVVGSSVLAFGVALLVLPGPAVVVIPVGLAILATEFLWARRMLHWMKTRVRSKS
jgi:cardiolipin synthase A/B